MATGTTAQQMIDVVTPAAGESVTEGTILEWQVKVGDYIKVDDTIVEISTDKVDVELPAPASGTVTEILAEEGETVTVGQVIARIAAQDAPAGNGAQQAPLDDGAPATVEGATSAVAEPPTGAIAEPPTGAVAETPTRAPAEPATALGDGAKISPVAARAAAIEGVNLAEVSGSGPSGRITKTDVLSAAGNGAAKTAAAPSNGAGEASERSSLLMKGGAAMLARYMDESRAIPTATSFRTLAVTQLESRRRSPT
jgi:2-oxoglutarate dehydrogenase E1 component